MLQSFQQFNQDKSIDQWEAWSGEQAPHGGNSFVQKINPKRDFLFIYISIYLQQETPFHLLHLKI